MNTVQLREELGELIHHCTNENFEKGYDPICDLIDDYDINRDDEGDEINYLDETYEYYENILTNASNNIFLLEKWMENPTTENIFKFKIWFYSEFKKINKNIFVLNKHDGYGWNKEISLFVMQLALDHFEDDYSVHKSGGYTKLFLGRYFFLQAIANANIL